MAPRRIGDVLVSRRVVTGAMVTAALAEAKRKGERVCTTLLRGGVDESRLAGALAELHGTPGVDLSRTVIPSDVLGILSVEVARADCVLPLSREGGRVHVAVATPDGATTQIDELRLATGQEVSVYVAVHGALKEAIEGAYTAARSGLPAWRGKAARSSTSHVERIQAATFARPPPSAAVLAAIPVGGGAAATRSATLGKVKLGRALVTQPVPPAPASEPSAARTDPAEDVEVLVDLEPMAFDPLEPLPLAAAEAAEQAEPPLLGTSETQEVELTRPDGKKLVLVVDDEPEVALLAGRALEKAGYSVITVGDGEAALAEAEARHPDVVLLDAMLPKLHGFEVCLRLRANPKTKRIPVIVMTAVYRGWRFADDAREAYGAEDYLEKPFSLADLRHRIQSALDRSVGKTRAAPPGFAEAYRKGREAFQTGKHGEAVAAFEQALKLDPFSPEAHAAMGVALRTLGDPFRAMTMLERAVELRPEDLTSLQTLANVYDRSGFFRKAIEALTRALAVAKDDETRERLRSDLLGRLDLDGASFAG